MLARFTPMVRIDSHFNHVPKMAMAGNGEYVEYNDHIKEMGRLTALIEKQK